MLEIVWVNYEMSKNVFPFIVSYTQFCDMAFIVFSNATKTSITKDNWQNINLIWLWTRIGETWRENMVKSEKYQRQQCLHI